MRIYQEKDYNAVSRRAASIIAAQVVSKPDCVLGLGRNGHIGFNEPCDEFPLATHLVDLTPSTIEANARFFASAGDVPKQALTMGIGTIMKARKILVVANGADKADAVAKAFAGPVTPSMPASILQLHPDVTLVGDGSALAKLMEVKG